MTDPHQFEAVPGATTITDYVARSAAAPERQEALARARKRLIAETLDDEPALLGAGCAPSIPSA